MINVKTDYNAVGDGIADDTQAIQNAINDASGLHITSSRVGEEIYFPNGNYLISNTLVITKTIIITGDSAIAGSHNNQLKRSTLKVKYPANGILLTRVRLTNGQEDQADGTIIKNIQIESDFNLPADRYVEQIVTPIQYGIHIDSAAFIKLENVTVTKIQGNGIYVSSGTSFENASNEDAITRVYTALGLINETVKLNRGSELIADITEMIHCAISNCQNNGLLVMAGDTGGDANGGVYLGLLIDQIGSWGIKDASGLGNTYLGCWVAECGHNEESSGNTVYVGGSYTAGLAANPSVDDSIKSGGSNYSSFIGCYNEDDSPPDFRMVTGVRVIGGDLSDDFIRWNENANANVHYSATQRVGDYSKLIFREQEYTDVNKNVREIRLGIPELESWSAIGFGYLPAINNRKVFNRLTSTWIDDSDRNTADSLSWKLKRGVSKNNNDTFSGGQIYNHANDNDRLQSYYDRTWIINSQSLYPAPVPQYIPTYGSVSFGWTDKHHPLNGGHFFFGNSIANQPSYFSFKINLIKHADKLTQAVNLIDVYNDYLINGVDPNSELGLVAAWLKPNDNDINKNFTALFSLANDVSPKPFSNTTAFSVGDHLIKLGSSVESPQFLIKIINHNPQPLLPEKLKIHILTLNIHIEFYEMWPGLGFTSA